MSEVPDSRANIRESIRVGDFLIAKTQPLPSPPRSLAEVTVSPRFQPAPSTLTDQSVVTKAKSDKSKKR